MSTQRTILELGLKDEGRLVSSEDFADASFEEPWKYERVEGRLLVLAPSGEGHVNASEPWRDRLGAYKLARPDIVQKVVSEAWLRVDNGTDRIGNIGVFLIPGGPVPKIPDRVPDLIFEVVSPDRVSRDRDYRLKRADYHRFGVRGYVIIDRFRQTVSVLTHEPAGYAERTLSIGETYTSPLLPGLAIPLSEVF
ncbi:Uma2 family endonuclease [Tundrisphaera lichenicola]|uniref:Uma2 family endonuclease n=1 Tax=Tundrisphaera lichenicola TaxID=2029860 RepID=UPI003EBC9130